MKHMTHGHAALIQFSLSALFVAGYFIVLMSMILGYVRTPDAWREAVIALLGVLSGQVVNIMSYWFARQRQTESGKEET